MILCVKNIYYIYIYILYIYIVKLHMYIYICWFNELFVSTFHLNRRSGVRLKPERWNQAGGASTFGGNRWEPK